MQAVIIFTHSKKRFPDLPNTCASALVSERFGDIATKKRI